VLRQSGCAALSTRDVAAAACVPLSQIHYHFGSNQGLVLDSTVDGRAQLAQSARNDTMSPIAVQQDSQNSPC
jgi:DNA-binding transcriptional regulator YbjK